MDPNNGVYAENFEMLKALYDFQAVYPKTISFDEGEHFILYQTSAKQRNWWQVVNMKGSIGFVPSNYVMKIKVEPTFLLGFLDTSLRALKQSKETEINGIIPRLELVERLEAKRTKISASLKSPDTDNPPLFDNEKHYMGNGTVKTGNLKSQPELMNQKPDDPLPPVAKLEELATPTAVIAHDNSFTSDPSEATNTISDDATIISQKECTQKEKPTELITHSFSQEMPVPNESTALKTSTSIDDSSLSMHISLEPTEVYQIVDSIRQTTNLSYKLSCVALRVVLSELEAIYSTKIDHLIEPFANHLSTPLEAPDEFIQHTHDSKRLKTIFLQLADCKNDSEQRTWVLHEDEVYITQFLTELNEILKNADKKICQYELSCDQYQSIINLIQYYQMETRWPIRQLLIESFKALCFVDVNSIDVLLTSVLPLELVQDMQSNVLNLERLKELAVMLTMIFSMGLQMPIHHREQIGEDFIIFLINMIEMPSQIDFHDALSDILISLILSINLQFDDFTENFVLTAMSKITSGKAFTEKILIMLNREEDPLVFFEHKRSVPNSVLKMFVDLFSTPDAARLFYTNDNKVLIDILVRQLSDLSPGDPLRRLYLELCRRIVRNTSYEDHTHRKSDLMKIFTRIFCEESDSSLKDQQLVREIANEFPQIFKA